MALQLINNLSAKWEPEKYTDEYRDNLMRMIQASSKTSDRRAREDQENERAAQAHPSGRMIDRPIGICQPPQGFSRG